MPSATALTLTLNVQVPSPGAVPLVRAIRLEEAVVVRLFTPPQTEVVESAMERPGGRVSTIFRSVTAEVPGLVIVKVRVEVPPGLMVLGAIYLIRLVFDFHGRAAFPDLAYFGAFFAVGVGRTFLYGPKG